MATEGFPGGVDSVKSWLADLFGEEPGRSLWTVLDGPLRLALAQGWILGTSGSRADDLAEELAAADSSHRRFPAMLAALADHWRRVYADLRDGAGVVNLNLLAGADMEAVVLTGQEYGDQVVRQVVGHVFITRLDGDGWHIAALSRKLPIPGWPPTEQEISGLEVTSRPLGHA
ncbi:hypothetical protein FraEuI1c_0262 [Pseudofrankia inefficax]|uniref:Uncharacterized protein n=1 Tax=Pseudofrankia inefficax (strain DSM 45817 / CECT 9037 / DDB 130130 / EuI1c) TaxID=298654 RepID=E3J657_PSEI1|nr:hypothetical protein FraEuI1c_0262 [Pseudofrankia inefficax]